MEVREGQSLCPYCSVLLRPRPTRKKKCPSCGQPILVRRGALLTETQAEEYDLSDRWLAALQQYGGSHELLTQERRSLSEHFGFVPPIRDTIWRLINTLSRENPKPEDQERILLLMADFVAEEGKDPRPYVQRAMQMKVRTLKKEIAREKRELAEFGLPVYVSVFTCNDQHVCQSCASASTRTYSAADFLASMPIATACQNDKGCRCWIGCRSSPA